jgi:hypothetical protein
VDGGLIMEGNVDTPIEAETVRQIVGASLRTASRR